MQRTKPGRVRRSSARSYSEEKGETEACNCHEFNARMSGELASIIGRHEQTSGQVGESAGGPLHGRIQAREFSSESFVHGIRVHCHLRREAT